jgi:hypothetical protein
MNRNRLLAFAVPALLLTGIVGLAGLASAGGARTERLRALAQKLNSVEGQVNLGDQQGLDAHMDAIEKILNGYQAAASLTCVSNGQQGSAERFTITDTATGTPIAKPTTLATCKQLLAVQNHDLICVSNGEFGSAERFDVYDIARKRSKNAYTDIKNCQTLVTRANATFVCQSNAQYGSAERFHLYNRVQDKVLGGDTTLDQCLGSIPN